MTKKSSLKSNMISQSVYMFTTIVAFFSGVISAPIFLYLSNNYSDYLLSMGRTRVTISLFLFWLILTIVFAVFLSELSGMNNRPAKAVSPSRSKKR